LIDTHIRKMLINLRIESARWLRWTIAVYGCCCCTK